MVMICIEKLTWGDGCAAMYRLLLKKLILCLCITSNKFKDVVIIETQSCKLLLFV